MAKCEKVSSHAPVRGHPVHGGDLFLVEWVSSHAPVRGHQGQGKAGQVDRCFKSCPREGASFSSYVSNILKLRFQVMPP